MNSPRPGDPPSDGRAMQLRFTRDNQEADEAIDRLMALVGGIQRPDIVRQMIIAALKAGQEDDGRADLKMINSTLKEMRFTAKAFAPYRDIRKVTVFGSARTRPEEPAYRIARELGEKLARAGYMVITGAGPGIMHAVNEGAGPEHSFGVNIRLPFEQNANAVFEGNPRLITYKYFFNRKVAFIKEADAVVLLPGGFGTLDEAMEVLTLLQTGKRYSLPLLLIDEPGSTYWSHVIRFFELELLARGYIDRADLDLFEHVQSIDEALIRLDAFYRRYHSLRYVDERLIIRMKSELDGARVAELNERFKDILVPGGEIAVSGALEAEADEPELAHLPRLVLDFNRHDFGRLRHLIDALNEA
jgi:uncharacterized protein (TIGR00730 family)